MAAYPSGHSLYGFESGGDTWTENTQSTGTNKRSPLRLDGLGEPPGVEQDAMNEVQGLLVGLELLNEVEGDEDDSWSLELDTDKSMYLPPISSTASDEYLYGSPEDHIVWNDLSDTFCGMHGYLPDKPLNFKAFLRKLRPSRRGWIECPSCFSYRHGEFAPEVWDIKHHFRFHHLENIKWADKSDGKVKVCNAIESLMKDPEVKDIMLELFHRCSEKRGQYQERIEAEKATRLDAAYYKAKLPSIDLFLFRLRITCDGQLMCDQPRCADLQAFESSRDALKSHFVENHCRHLYEDDQWIRRQIEDNVANDTDRSGTAETVDQLVERAAAWERKWDSMDDDHKRRAKELDAQRKHRRAAVYQRVHRMRQWGVLRDLRKKFYERHNEFQKLATCAEPPVRLFAKRCKRPGGLLRLGILTFKKILRGRSPKTLFEVFAFISLPYAMATVMHGRGIQVEFAPRICDFSTWKESIIDIDEQLTFDQLVVSVWGLDHSIYQSDAGKLASYSVREIWDTFAEKHPQPDQSSQASMKEAIMQFIKAGSADEAFNFSAFLHINRVSNTDQCRREHPAQQDTSHSSELHQRDTSPGRNETSDQKCSTAASLKATVIFINTQLFMIFIAQFGVILIYFGDEERRCQLSTVNDQSATVRDIVEAAEGMKSTILNPLLDDERFSTIRHLFAAMDEFLELGFIWNVLDLSCYMIIAVVRLVKDWHIRSLLCNEIKKRCSGELNSTSLGYEKRPADTSSQRSTKRRRYMEETEASEDPSSRNNPSLHQREFPTEGAERSVCDNCGKIYSGPNSLNSLGRHKRERHSESSWRCPDPCCSHYSKRRHNLHDHIKRKHGRHTHADSVEVLDPSSLMSTIKERD